MEKIVTLTKRGTASYLARMPSQFRQLYAMAREELSRRESLVFAFKLAWEGLRLHFAIPDGAERSSILKDADGKCYTRDARGTVRKFA